MDAFFAAIEERDNPAYRGKPVVVGSDPKEGKGRGVVSTCSYAARKYGIHSAMPISIAYKKCPTAIFLPVNMQKYAEESDKIFKIFERFTPDIEPISIDEAFLDISGSYQLFGTPLSTCRMIKKAIFDGTGLTASLGLAPNMMTAKIASEFAKPDGLTVVEETGLLDFLHPLPIGKLWGIGDKSEETLKKLGINTIGDIAKMDLEKITRLFGKNGKHVWDLANGIDPREVEEDHAIKSVSNEHTFGEDTQDKELIRNTLMYLSEKVSRRLRKHDFKCRTVTLKIRFGDFTTLTRAVTMQSPSNFTSDIYEKCLDNLNKLDLKRKKVRLLGVHTSNLGNSAWKTDLFADTDTGKTKKEKVESALNKIKDRFGEGAIGYRNP